LEGIIEVENPNLVKKENISIKELKNMTLDDPSKQLTRRDREAMAKHKAEARQNEADRVRLEKVRKERDEAAKRRELEKEKAAQNAAARDEELRRKQEEAAAKPGPGRRKNRSLLSKKDNQDDTPDDGTA